MDFLCGTSETGFPTTDAYAGNVTDNSKWMLPSERGRLLTIGIHKVASIVLYGDPSFVKDLSWDQGTANNTSFFPRQDNTACDPVADQRKNDWSPILLRHVPRVHLTTRANQDN